MNRRRDAWRDDLMDITDDEPPLSPSNWWMTMTTHMLQPLQSWKFLMKMFLLTEWSPLKEKASTGYTVLKLCWKAAPEEGTERSCYHPGVTSWRTVFDILKIRAGAETKFNWRMRLTPSIKHNASSPANLRTALRYWRQVWLYENLDRLCLETPSSQKWS